MQLANLAFDLVNLVNVAHSCPFPHDQYGLAAPYRTHTEAMAEASSTFSGISDSAAHAPSVAEYVTPGAGASPKCAVRPPVDRRGEAVPKTAAYTMIVGPRLSGEFGVAMSAMAWLWTSRAAKTVEGART